MEFELTKEEQKAIAALKRVARKWPETLWLFSGSGTLYVMRKNEDSQYAHGGGNISHEGVDPDYVVDTIAIENDGGDW
jgi:hypothetical protein